MTNPTPERIAAALALADHIDRNMGDGLLNEWTKAQELTHAYRATAPKLTLTLTFSGHTHDVPLESLARFLEVQHGLRMVPCAEPPASEPNRVTDHDADQRPEDPNHTGVIRPPAYGPSSVDSSSPSEPAAGATLSEVEACGCEESDDLKDKLTECRRLLRAIHGFAKSITELSVEVP